MKLYEHQEESVHSVFTEWKAGRKNVLLVSATGSGKTVMFCAIVARFKSIFPSKTGKIVINVHRQEIISQICKTLAKFELEHQIVGSEKLIKSIREMHRIESGRNWVSPYATIYVTSVDTIDSRSSAFTEMGQTVDLWVQDETHHLVESNKWGRVIDLFPNALGLGVTATPERPDGQGLKRGRGGYFDVMVQGKSMRWLIDYGFLKDYIIYAPPVSMNRKDIKLTKSGDFSPKGLSMASEKSTIVGDVVETYKKLANGTTAVVFAVDVKAAERLISEFKAAGVPAKILTAKSSIDDRNLVRYELETGDLSVVVSVDLLGEGFDLPRIQTAIFARPTMSFVVYSQQFGRALRPYLGTKYATIIDHVGNVSAHGGPPDFIETWSLEVGKCRNAEVLPPWRSCLECWGSWEGWSRTCPHCGHVPPVESKTELHEVAGDLSQLDLDSLRQLKGLAARAVADTKQIISPLIAAGAKSAAINGLAARHKERREAQEKLRTFIAAWAAYIVNTEGVYGNDRYPRFFKEFGVDVMSAQALSARKATDLTYRIERSMQNVRKEM